MAPEPFVCPHCRTWVEGEGRTIRCPSCGKRFRADEARLDRPRPHATFESLDYEVPQGEARDHDQRRGGAVAAGAPLADSMGWGEPEAATYRSPDAQDYEAPDDDAPDYEVPEYERPESAWEPTSEPWPPQETASEDADSEPKGAGIPWGWITTIGFAVLFFVGSRFLSGELFVIGFIALIAVNWFFDRTKDKGSE